MERFEPEAPGLGLPSKTVTLPMYFGQYACSECHLSLLITHLSLLRERVPEIPASELNSTHSVWESMTHTVHLGEGSGNEGSLTHGHIHDTGQPHVA